METNELDGIWTARFISGQKNFGAGIIIIKNTQIIGGDAQYYYSGKLSLFQEIINTEIKVKIHTRIPGGQSIFGSLDSFSISLSGKASSSELTLIGTLDGSPAESITVVCSRIENLPF